MKKENKWAYDRGRYRPPPPPTSSTSDAANIEQTPSTPTTTTAKKRLGNVKLPFLSGVTEPLARLLNGKGLSTSISSRGSIREILVKPKDKLKKEETVGHIYHIPCAGANSTACQGRYVGETERTAAARFKEHTSTATNGLGNYKSAMLEHAREAQHHFREEDITILSSEHDWVKRGIREALFIKALKPSINIDPGRHALSCHFDSILETVISAPPAPTTHNGETETLINTAPRRQGRPRKLPASINDTHVKTVDRPQQPQLPMRQSQRIRSRQQQEQ